MSQWRALYPLIMLVGLAVAYLVFRRRAQASSLDKQEKAAIALAAFIGAMLGAKMPFLLGSMSSSPSLVLWLADGKTILGGIFGGYVAVEIAKWLLKIKQRTGDQFAVPVAIAVATGRLGCFVAGCCYGKPTTLPWGCVFPTANDTLLRHPTQLYEFVFHASAACTLLLMEQRGWLRTRRLAAYLVCYLVFRFVSEWIRPEPVIVLGLTAYQLACLALASALILLELASTASDRGDAKAIPR